MRLDLLLIGFGNVGRELVRLLQRQRTVLARDFGVSVRVLGIATRRGQTFAAHGLDTGRIRLAAPGAVDAFLRKALEHCRSAARHQRLVVVETTPLNVDDGEPAAGYIRTALAGGAHVVSTNKGPPACAYTALRRAAAAADRRWLFEGAVMDGVPIFNLVRETLPAVGIKGFRGVINSTTNFMLTAMEQGRLFDEALRDMQAAGIAEADASLDVDGWDAAAKTAALANVLMGARLTPRLVMREGISRETGALAAKARSAGRRLKLVARASREGRRVTARVSPEELPDDDVLARVHGQQNALVLQTDLLGEIAVVQRSGSLTQTAYAVLSDLLRIASDVTAGGARPRRRRRARRGRSLSASVRR